MTGVQGVGVSGSQRHETGSFIDAVAVVWSTGYQFLGASYSVAVI